MKQFTQKCALLMFLTEDLLMFLPVDLMSQNKFSHLCIKSKLNDH